MPHDGKYTVMLDCYNCGASNVFDLNKEVEIKYYTGQGLLRCSHCECTTISPDSPSPVITF